MQKYPIIVLVGPSGGGKTTILRQIHKRFPITTAPLKSVTTRPARGPEDQMFYHFLTPEAFQKLQADGRLLQSVTFANNYYGTDREEVNAIVSQKIGLIVLVEQSLADYHKAGYRLHVVRIVPDGHKPRNEALRLKEDAERAKMNIHVDHTIVNSFKSGGLRQAVDELAKDVENILRRSPPNALHIPHQQQVADRDQSPST